MLLKALGARFGAGGTTAAGAAVVSRFLAGAAPDARGRRRLGPLATATARRPLDVVTLLRDLSPGGDAVAAGDRRRHCAPSLPVAARERHARRCACTARAAAGRCVAKTGTLSDASDLAGWCDGTFAFAFLMNHVDVDRRPARAGHDGDRARALAKLAAPAG